jgi:hypothetical protein
MAKTKTDEARDMLFNFLAAKAREHPNMSKLELLEAVGEDTERKLQKSPPTGELGRRFAKAQQAREGGQIVLVAGGDQGRPFTDRGGNLPRPSVVLQEDTAAKAAAERQRACIQFRESLLREEAPADPGNSLLEDAVAYERQRKHWRLPTGGPVPSEPEAFARSIRGYRY